MALGKLGPGQINIKTLCLLNTSFNSLNVPQKIFRSIAQLTLEQIFRLLRILWFGLNDAGGNSGGGRLRRVRGYWAKLEQGVLVVF